MSDIERVQGWFDSGRLVKPSAEELNFVDLVRALARLAGAKEVDASPGVEELCRRIGAAEHYVFVLVDGLGMDLVERLPAGSFLRDHLVARLQSVFPSTTAAALTTLATAQWPASHGVPGWWGYLAGRGIHAVTLPFEERGTGRPLAELGVTVEELFPVPSIWPRLRYKPVSVVPANVAHSVYSTYASGGTQRAGYGELAQGREAVCRAVENASGPTCVYLYLPQLDAVCHRKGPEDEQAQNMLAMIDHGLGRLAEALTGRARLIISADHGQVTVAQDRRFVLPATDPLGEHLRCQPSGEPAVPFFFVRDGDEEAFATRFQSRFGEYFALLSPEEVEELHLLGPEELSPVTRRRLGTFVGIAPEPATFFIEPVDANARFAGVHGGLRPSEMYVPLVLA